VNYYTDLFLFQLFLQEINRKLITHSNPHPIIYKIADAIENTRIETGLRTLFRRYRKCRENKINH
jgi:hypothetical protein